MMVFPKINYPHHKDKITSFTSRNKNVKSHTNSKIPLSFINTPCLFLASFFLSSSFHLSLSQHNHTTHSFPFHRKQHPSISSIVSLITPDLFADIASSSSSSSSFVPDLFSNSSSTMGRTVDQEVHAAFVEFRAKEDDKVGYITLHYITVLPYIHHTYKHTVVLQYHTDHDSASPSNASTAK